MIDSGYTACRSAINFDSNIRIVSTATVGGKKEKKGPLGQYIDIYCEDEKLGQDSWEKAESEMCRLALETALAKGNLTENNVDFLFAGDLMNQCTGSGYGLLEFDIPYIGLYGACSTFAEGIMIGATFIESGKAKCVAVVVSSHFCSAERQFRFPLEYGSFAETTAQNTVTGAAAVILSKDDKVQKGAVYITSALPGIVCDRGIKDASNMGAAMCSAAKDTITRYFKSSQERMSDFDLIATGDLGLEGKSLLCDLMRADGADVGDNLDDCGTMIYDLKKQEVGCGGSGCGCSAMVTGGYIYEHLLSGVFRKCLIIGTGAMMSPQSLLQGSSIPAVAHLIKLEAFGKEGE